MTDGVSESLVNEIVRRVLGAMGEGTSAAARPAAGARPAATVTPVVPAARSRVWLTEAMLAGRSGQGQVVTLGPNEFLTPAARDYAAAKGIEIARADPRPAPSAGGGRVRPAVLTRTLGLVVRRPDAKVESALAAVTRAGVATVGFAQWDCWMANTREMCGAVAGGELAGGTVIDRYAAAAVVLAGKCAGIRPVQGVSPAAVTAALRQFDANVLVIGHAACSVYEIRSMIDRFAAGRRMDRQRTPLLEAVEQLETEGPPCG